MADWNKPPTIDLSNNTYTFIVTFFIYFLFFFAFFYRALGFGSSLPFCAEKRSSLLHESEEILCCFARKASVRRHESTATILVLRDSFACQHNWRLRWGTKHRAVSGLFLLRKERHQEAAVYKGNMNSQSYFVDANNSYAEVARFFNMNTVSASPSSCYVQTPIQNNLHPSTCYNFDNMQHIYSNSHASAAPEVHMPMNNMMNSVNQYETSNVINFNSMQNNVSSFYPSANNLQYFGSPSHMPMNIEISHDTTNCLNNYSQPSYAAPYVTNFSAPYATPYIHYSAAHLHNNYSRISENSIEAHVSSFNTVACDTPPKQLQNFGNIKLSLPRNTERFEGRTSEEWADLYLESCENLAKKLVEVRAIGANQKKVDSVSTANSDKAGLDNTCSKLNQQKMISMSVTTDLVQAELNLGKAKSDTHAEFVNLVDTSFVEQEYGECETAVLDFSGCKGAYMLPYEFRAKEIDEHPQNKNIAEPSSVEKEHQSEESQDVEKKEDKKLENYQEAEQNFVQVVQRPYSLNVIDFENKKMLIRSDQTESARGKNVLIDDSALPRMIRPKNAEVGVLKVNGNNNQLPRRKPTVSMLLEKYTSRKADNMFNRLGGNKRAWSRSRHGGHEHWQENLYKRRPYFPVYPPWGFSSWTTYRTRPAGYFQSGWISSRPMFRQYLHEKKGSVQSRN
jgi:hypothetical protein